MSDREFWEFRATHQYQYRGETFYTITPVPFYCSRRGLVLRLMEEYLDWGGHLAFATLVVEMAGTLNWQDVRGSDLTSVV